MALAQPDGAAIARRQRLILAPASAVPDRTDGMDHTPRRQLVAIRDFSVAGLAALQRAAFAEKFWPGRAMDRAIHAPSAQQGRVRGVDDGVNA